MYVLMMGFIALIKNKVPSVGSIFFSVCWRNLACLLFSVITINGHTAGLWMGTDMELSAMIIKHMLQAQN